MFESFFAYHPPSASVDAKANEVDYAKNPTKLFKRIEGRSWESAMERIHNNSSEAQIWVLKRSFDGSVTWRRLPLHEACIRKPTQKIVKALLSAYHNAASIQDGDGRLPLHHACANSASPDIIESLLVAFPEAIDVKDGWQKTPLQTLMSQFFPDPHCISALKRGVSYYKSKKAMNSVPTPTSNQNFPPLSRSLSLQTPPVTSLRYDEGNTKMHDIESEIGRFTHKLAMNSDHERNLQHKIRVLEEEINRLSEVERENMRLNTDVRDLGRELQLVRDAFENERQQNNHYLQTIDDMRKMEENLKQQIDDLANDPTKRILDEKVASLSAEIQEKDMRYERDIHNLQNMLRNVERDAEAAASAANKFETESKNMQLELKKMEYDNESQSNALGHLKRELFNMKELRTKLDEVERDRQNLDNEVRRLLRNLQMAEQEVSNLKQENFDLSRMTDELKRRSSNNAMDLQDELKQKENETKRLEEQIAQLKTNEKNLKHSFDDEKKELKKSVDYLMEELQKVQKENISQLKEKVEYEKQLEDMQLQLSKSSRKVNEAVENEEQRSKEIEKLKVDMEDKTKELTKKLLQEQSRCAEIERELKHLKQHIKIATAAGNQATKQVLELNKKNNDHLQEIQSLQEEQQNLERALAQSRMDKDQIKSRELEIDKKCKEMQLELDEISKDRVTLQSETQQLQCKIQKLESEKKSLEESLQSLKEGMQRGKDHENLYEELEKAKTEISSLTDALKLRQGEISFLKFALEKENRNNRSSSNNNFTSTTNVLEQQQMDNLKRENSMLRALLEESDDHSNSSLSYLEERLLALEKVKDTEIAILVQERDDLMRETEILKDRIITLESDIARIKEDNRYSNSQIAILRNKRDKKKKTIEERLKDYETRSCASSVIPTSNNTRERFVPLSLPLPTTTSMPKLDQVVHHHDNMSVVSGISMDVPITITSSTVPASMSYEKYLSSLGLQSQQQMIHNQSKYLFPSAMSNSMPIPMPMSTTTGMNSTDPLKFTNVNNQMFKSDRIPSMISTSTPTASSTSFSKSSNNVIMKEEKEARDDLENYSHN